MSTKFFLRNKKDEFSPINIIVLYKGERFKFSTRITVETKYWNQER